jgi:hypothetical protein
MIVITIDTDNESFEDNGLIYELEKIFNKIIGKIERSDTFGIQDSKGNIVGNFKTD